ncbi:50S ribosomal protein L22 [Kiloniella laminariae]|uniref:Large ribosomal subunit protein uL22 n=1 Tax=Kiloniella laminariae TaxID=454162 RepID=A0ABT4LPE7_9PROT|nr:50S ribosomal protein L22 [Kiloniella laminariae]MCZ4283012.1 50S ribosomal protein L22 [Kiloniella laminariae]
MSKSKRDRALADTEARAVAVNLRTSPRKLNLVAASIRGKSAESALAELTFSKRRIAIEVKKALQSAIANAENNHQLDVDRLFVAEAFVGKSFVMKRFRARARGRTGRLLKPWSQLTVVVREREEAA